MKGFIGLKRMMAGLAWQDSPEFVSLNEGVRLMGQGMQVPGGSLSSTPSQTLKPATRRIALVSNDRGIDGLLEYAIETCQRLDARLDLLTPAVCGAGEITAQERRLRQAGVDFLRISLGAGPVDDVLAYIASHPSLLFLLASPEDGVAKTLLEDVIPQRGRRLQVPLVLIEDRPATGKPAQSAA